MTKIIMCLQFPEEFDGRKLPEDFTKEDLATANVVQTYGEVPHESSFEEYIKIGENAVQFTNEVREALTFFFHEVMRSLIDNEILSPEGKFLFNDYNAGSYIDFGTRLAKELFDKFEAKNESNLAEIRKAKEANEKDEKLKKDYIKHIVLIEKMIEPDEQNAQYRLDCLEAIEIIDFAMLSRNEVLERKTFTAIEMWGFSSGLSTFIGLANVLKKKFSKGFSKPFNFDHEEVRRKFPPALEKILNVGLKSLENDPEIQKVIAGFNETKIEENGLELRTTDIAEQTQPNVEQCSGEGI